MSRRLVRKIGCIAVGYLYVEPQEPAASQFVAKVMALVVDSGLPLDGSGVVANYDDLVTTSDLPIFGIHVISVGNGCAQWDEHGGLLSRYGPRRTAK